MALTTTLIMNPSEILKQFNTRIAAVCNDPASPITDARLEIVGKQPMVILISELAPAAEVLEDPQLTPEEIEELGDVPVTGPFMCKLAQLNADDSKRAAKSEEYMEGISELSEGLMADIKLAKAPNGTTYALNIWDVEAADDLEDGEENPDEDLNDHDDYDPEGKIVDAEVVE